MTDREKLIELLSADPCRGAECGTCERIVDVDCYTKQMADHLLASGVTVQKLDGCEYCHGLPKSERDCFTMPNASKRDYDIVTIKFCPMCGRKFPEPPKD